MALEPGLSASVRLTVTEADTAQALGSGDVPVLATPRLLALAEAATVRATARHLPAGTTTVGTRVALEHLAATPIGGTVTVEARLSTVDGRRLTFAVTATDGSADLARGSVERVLVDRERFLAKVGG
ncbi:MAG: thioesterase [Actinobacteria bacterium 13_1_20CM_3_71_11]|nr:MAG: thioesterase [Actinobacteria bacterium 13_1_20CM_3_71_11]